LDSGPAPERPPDASPVATPPRRRAGRDVLASILDRSGKGAGRVLCAVRLVARYVRSPGATLAEADEEGRADLVVAGVLALAVGAAISVAIARARGIGWGAAGIYAEALVAWALVRLIVLHLAVRADSGGARVAVRTAWGPALLPFLFAAASPLDLAALGASALLTFVGLEAVGMPRRDALRCVAWAVGGQLAVLVAAWFGRSWFFLLLR
jgi:hypothetical protein